MTLRIEHGCCLEIMRALAAEGVQADSIVTDPPYHLTSGKRGGTGIASLNPNSPAGRSQIGTGFMGKGWDGGDIAADPETWRLAFTLLKPGGHLVAFGGTRTYHRMVCAIEDAGFEVRDMLCWLYASGFPKSRSMRDIGRPELGTALKPSHEPIVLARKPLAAPTIAANVLKYGTGALNIDGCRIEATDNITFERFAGERSRENYRTGTTGAARPSALGRWPANLLHDSSAEVLEAFAAYGERHSQDPGTRARKTPGIGKNAYHGENSAAKVIGSCAGFGDSGTAARFFFSAKAGEDDRADSKHPTVKPVALMRWLARLVTPQKGTVLDPFAGSGTTGVACLREGFNAILIERDDQYHKDILHRIAKLSGLDAPLFAGLT